MSDPLGIDGERLSRWLSGRLPGFEGPIEVERFVGGQSNPTYRLSGASGTLVLRKQPPGKLVPSAHAIDREYRILDALGDSGVPVPAVRLYCDDASVIGTPFYVMEYVEGRVSHDPLLPDQDAASRSALYDSMNEALARLHLFDWRAAGLDDFGKPVDYFARQVGLWSRQYDKARTNDVPAMDSLRRWLEQNLPDDQAATVVHGDYRIGNLIIHPSRPQVVAVLDWELSTIGHPLADLAFNCMTYRLQSGHPIAPGFVGTDLAGSGIPSEGEYLDAYARRTGRDPSPMWRFCMAFSLYRVAAIQAGVYARALAGNAVSETARRFGDSFRLMAGIGWQVASDGESSWLSG